MNFKSNPEKNREYENIVNNIKYNEYYDSVGFKDKNSLIEIVEIYRKRMEHYCNESIFSGFQKVEFQGLKERVSKIFGVDNQHKLCDFLIKYPHDSNNFIRVFETPKQGDYKYGLILSNRLKEEGEIDQYDFIRNNKINSALEFSSSLIEVNLNQNSKIDTYYELRKVLNSLLRLKGSSYLNLYEDNYFNEMSQLMVNEYILSERKKVRIGIWGETFKQSMIVMSVIPKIDYVAYKSTFDPLRVVTFNSPFIIQNNFLIELKPLEEAAGGAHVSFANSKMFKNEIREIKKIIYDSLKI